MRFILITAAQSTFSLILFFFGGRGNFALSAFLTVSSTGFAANEPGANLSYAFQLFRHFCKLFPESLKGLLWVSCCLIFLFIFALLQNIPNVYFCRLYQFFFVFLFRMMIASLCQPVLIAYKHGVLLTA
jgi:hypothetical protein